MGQSIDLNAKSDIAEANVGQMVHEEETEKGPGDGAPLISAFAGLSRSQAIRKFWRIFLAGMAPTLGGMYVSPA